MEIFIKACEEKLFEIEIKWNTFKSLCIVVCSKGYPGEYKKNVVIKNLNKINLSDKDFIFHAGTLNKNNKILSNGGRVLNFVSLSENFKNSREKSESY